MDLLKKILSEVGQAFLDASSREVEELLKLRPLIGDDDFPINFGNPFIGVEDTSGLFRSSFFDSK